MECSVAAGHQTPSPGACCAATQPCSNIGGPANAIAPVHAPATPGDRSAQHSAQHESHKRKSPDSSVLNEKSQGSKPPQDNRPLSPEPGQSMPCMHAQSPSTAPPDPELPPTTPTPLNAPIHHHQHEPCTLESGAAAVATGVTSGHADDIGTHIHADGSTSQTCYAPSAEFATTSTSGTCSFPLLCLLLLICFTPQTESHLCVQMWT